MKTNILLYTWWKRINKPKLLQNDENNCQNDENHQNMQKINGII